MGGGTVEVSIKFSRSDNCASPQWSGEAEELPDELAEILAAQSIADGLTAEEGEPSVGLVLSSRTGEHKDANPCGEGTLGTVTLVNDTEGVEDVEQISCLSGIKVGKLEDEVEGNTTGLEDFEGISDT